MPRSRKRRTRPVSHDLRRARRRRDRRLKTLDDIVNTPPTEAEAAAYVAALEAGARGDVAESLRREFEAMGRVSTPHLAVVKDLLDLGDAAPPWAYSRFCADLAYRRMLLAEHQGVQQAVRVVLAALHPSTYAALDDPRSLTRVGTQIAAMDPLAVDLAVFEFGGLRDYLDDVARPGLLDRADRVHEWASAPMGVYGFVDFRGCRLVLHDLVADEEVEVLNVGAMSETDDDRALVGRVVPISAEPGLMFAARPVAVDPVTAFDVAARIADGTDLGWLVALGAAVDAGRLPERFHMYGMTPLTTDLTILDPIEGDEGAAVEEPPQLRRWRARGYPPLVVNALGVLGVCLLAAGRGDWEAAVAAPHVSAALQTPGAFEAAMVECAGPETAQAWRLLAAVVPEHVVDHCRMLAERAALAA